MHLKSGWVLCAVAALALGVGNISTAVAGPAIIIRPPRPPLPPLSRLKPIVRSGSVHNCALMPNGTLKCWGSNNYGIMALGYTGGAYPTPVTPLTFGAAILDVATNYFHSCAVLSNFTVQCWGYNDEGQLGDGTTTNSGIPLTVPAIWSATRVATGQAHSCAMLSDGHVLCWGHNQRGQLGDGTFISRRSPGVVAGIVDAIDIAASGDHTCARQRSGLVACWGSGQSGELGNGYADSAYPLGVVGLANVDQLALGLDHTCARRNEGYVACWGANYYGQLGDGSSDLYRDTPGRVPLDSVDSVAAGAEWTCATRSDLNANNAFCWGGNPSGQLGDGTTTTRTLPTQVALAEGHAVSMSAGDSHTCAVLSDSSARCWGWNVEGELGRGSVSPWFSPWPAPVVSFP